MFYPHPYQFGHPTQFPFLPYPTDHLPMPIYQQIPKDVKQRDSEDAKDGLYRNCLVCGDQNIKCGWFVIIAENKIKIMFFSG
jgi:hypothetical protein